MMVAAGRTRAQCAKLSARAFEASSTRTSNSTATSCHFFAQIGTQANILMGLTALIVHPPFTLRALSFSSPKYSPFPRAIKGKKNKPLKGQFASTTDRGSNPQPPPYADLQVGR